MPSRWLSAMAARIRSSFVGERRQAIVQRTEIAEAALLNRQDTLKYESAGAAERLELASASDKLRGPEEQSLGLSSLIRSAAHLL